MYFNVTDTKRCSTKVNCPKIELCSIFDSKAKQNIMEHVFSFTFKLCCASMTFSLYLPPPPPLWDDKGKNVHMKVTITYKFSKVK